MSTVTFSSNSGGVLTLSIVNAGIGSATTVIIEGYTSIGDSAFSTRGQLTSVTIGNSVTNIGNFAFNSCYNLTSIIIPNSVTSISGYAFQRCSGLKSLTIGNSVTSIGIQSFFLCTSLTTVTFISNSTLVSIGNDAFNNCTNLKYITIPISVSTIAVNAFNSSGLNTVFITNNQVISGITFLSPSSDVSFFGRTVIIPSGSVTFNGSGQLTKNIVNAGLGTASIVIIEGYTSIGAEAFYEKTQITSVIISDSVISIGLVAFMSCSALSSVTIPNSVLSIGNAAFRYCSALTSFTIPNLLTTLNGALFESTGLTSIIIPNLVESIDFSVFQACSQLTSITIPNSVTYLGDSIFKHCIGLTSITIPNSVTTISRKAFEGCFNLTSITIPNSVTSIGGTAFMDCRAFTSITIPNSVTHLGADVILNCSNINSVTINTPLSKTMMQNAFAGVNNNNMSWTFDYNGAIPESACDGRTLMRTLNIGNSITSVGDNSFFYCSNLETVLIPNSVTSIGNSAFKNCFKLTSVILGNSVTSIGFGAFERDVMLTSISIPRSVNIIDILAFNSCTNLTSVIIRNPLNINVSTNSFSNVSNKNSSITFINTDDYNDLSSTWKTISTYYASQEYIPAQLEPVVIFPEINATYGDSPATISYISNSPGAVIFTCSDNSIATINGSIITFIGAGSATITATQEETDYYLSATTTTNLFVNKAIPLLTNFNLHQTGETFPIEPPQSNSDGSFSYTSSDTQVATISGNLCTALSIGTTTITANQSESSNYYSGQISSILRISNICFPAGTPIYTDQGVVNIEKINTNINTIDNKKIVAITQIYSTDDFLVCFEKNSLGNNIPSQKTIISKYHGIYYNGELRRAYTFIKKNENVNKIEYTGEILYNVLMEEYYKININNMICETLDPTNDIAKTYL